MSGRAAASKVGRAWACAVGGPARASRPPPRVQASSSWPPSSSSSSSTSYLPLHLSTRNFTTTSPPHARKQDHYAVFGLPRNASKAQIKARFYEVCHPLLPSPLPPKLTAQLSKKHHPDAAGGTGTADQFHKINDAYAVLGDDGARAAYDASTAPASSRGVSADGSFHPHSPQSRRSTGPHRAWGGRAPPPPSWAGKRKVAPDLGWGSGMGGTMPGYSAPHSAHGRWGRKEEKRRQGEQRLDDDVAGESVGLRFVIVVLALVGIWSLASTVAKADGGDGDEGEGDDEESWPGRQRYDDSTAATASTTRR